MVHDSQFTVHYLRFMIRREREGEGGRPGGKEAKRMGMEGKRERERHTHTHTHTHTGTGERRGEGEIGAREI